MKLQTTNLHLVLLLLGGLLTANAEARTWRVALDGSGDTDSIHEAGQLAASGDTISIAPGRYSTLVDHSDGWTDRKVIAAIDGNKDLVIIGDHQDSVVVGPMIYEIVHPDSPVALYWRSTGRLYLRDVTLVNSYAGLRSDGGGVVAEECALVGNYQGMVKFFAGKVELYGCRFESIGSAGEAPVHLSIFCQDVDTLVVSNSVFINSGEIDLEYMDYVEMQRSMLEDVRFELNTTTGLIEDCLFDREVSVVNAFGGHVVLNRNQLLTTSSGQEYGLIALYSTTNLHLSGNLIEQAEGGTIQLKYGASIQGSGNHILNGFGVSSVHLENYPEGNTATIDLRNNWWGTPDSNLVASWIWDGTDDPSIHAVVDYLPIETEPVPTEKQSLGGLKALFRDATR